MLRELAGHYRSRSKSFLRQSEARPEQALRIVPNQKLDSGKERRT
jgi:hypothetical protein